VRLQAWFGHIVDILSSRRWSGQLFSLLTLVVLREWAGKTPKILLDQFHEELFNGLLYAWVIC